MAGSRHDRRGPSADRTQASGARGRPGSAAAQAPVLESLGRGSAPPAAVLASQLPHLQRAVGNGRVTGLLAERRTGAGTPVQRYFDPPPMGNWGAIPITKGGGKKAGVPQVKQGWALDKETAAAQEITPAGVSAGRKTTRLTALLTPGHVKVGLGKPTTANVQPIGWGWIAQHEVRTVKRQAIAYWVKFHLLNAKLGGKGHRELHLIPADKAANSQWEAGIEAPMKTAVAAHPVHYDVKVEYYTAGEAPPDYQIPNGVDYRDNITLFPKTITGRLLVFKNNRWTQAAACTTTSGKPAGPGGGARELIGEKNLGMLASIYKVDPEVLGIVQRRAGQQTYNRYGDVRRVLENWVAQAAGDTKSYAARSQKLAKSDAYLRAALNGQQGTALTINNAAVPDDTTPLANFMASPARVKTADDVRDFPNTSPPITRAYQHAAGGPGRLERIPTMQAFFESLVGIGYWGDVTYAKIQSDWDTFAASPNLLPMIHTDFAPDGEEVLVTVLAKEPQIVAALRDWCARKLGGNVPPSARTAIDELVGQARLQLRAFVQTNFDVLTIHDYSEPKNTVRKLLGWPAVDPLCRAFEHRAQLAAKIRELRLQGLPDPFAVGLTVPLDPRVEAHIDFEVGAQQRRAQAEAEQRRAQQEARLRQGARPGDGRVGAGGRMPSSLKERSRARAAEPYGHRKPPSPRSDVHPHNQNVIRTIIDRCRDYELLHADLWHTRGMEGRKDEVLRKWRTPVPKGSLDLRADVDRAMRWIIERR